MTIVSEYIDLKISMKNIEWLNSKGYFGELKEVIKIYWEDLPPFSKKELTFKCDYCSCNFNRLYSAYNRHKEKSPTNTHACRDCKSEKIKDSNLKKYGVENVMQVSEHKESLENSMMKKYGVINYSMTDEWKNKIIETSINKYGVEYYFKSEEFKNKIIASNLEKYGTEYYMSTDEFKVKSMKTLSRLGLAPTSKQQEHIHTLVGGELNFQISKCFLDIAFTEDKIYLEYDGGGHNLSVKLGNVSQEDFDKKERNRYFLLKHYGYKEIRILCETDKLIEDNYIVKFVEDAKHLLKNSEASSVRLDMDNMKYSISYKEWIEYDMKGGLLQLAH